MTRVLHVNDAASTARVILAEASRQGLPWSFLPRAVADPDWTGPVGALRRAARGLAWEARLARRAARVDVLHVHVASVARHTWWVPRPYVLHLHGTDIRSHQYQEVHRATIRRAVTKAAAVVYSTPDLAPHIAWRPDAQLLPVPIDVAALPPWTPPRTGRVVFASRWDPVKGLDVQLAVARQLRLHLGRDVDLVGLEWGSGAPLAREAGVTLVPRLDHAEFLDLLAGADAVVGQPTGMLAASELEAIGIGAPVVAALNPEWYGAGEPLPPVRGGLATGAAFALPPQDPATGGRSLTAEETEALAAELSRLTVAALSPTSGATKGVEAAEHPRHWLERHHGAARAVATLEAIYSGLERR